MALRIPSGGLFGRTAAYNSCSARNGSILQSCRSDRLVQSQSESQSHSRLASLTRHLRRSSDRLAATCPSVRETRTRRRRLLAGSLGVVVNLNEKAGRAGEKLGRSAAALVFGATWGRQFPARTLGTFPAISGAATLHSTGSTDQMTRGIPRESEHASVSAPNNDGSDAFAYQIPPLEIAKIVDAAPTPVLSFSPLRDEIVYLQRPGLPPVEDLAKPELKLAGLRIDPDSNTRSRMSSYTGMTITSLISGDGSRGPEREVTGLPEGAKINFVSWSPDGRHLAFAVHVDTEEQIVSPGLALWVANVATGQARELFGPPDCQLNTVFDSYGWIDETTIIACVVPALRNKRPQKSIKPFGPKVQSNESGEKAQARTFQDLLKDGHDEELFAYYSTSQLVHVDINGQMKNINEPRIYTSVEPSPDGQFMIVVTMHRPFSFVVPCGRFPKKVEVWTRDGTLVQEICDLPLAENIPIAFNSVRTGRRSIGWRPDQPASLYWVETQDGGDAKVECSPRDIVYTAAMGSTGFDPKIIAKLDLRYGGIVWGDESLALVYESWWKQRRSRTWVIKPGQPEMEPKILFDRSYEDAYSDPGSPMTRRTPLGTYILAKIVRPDGAERLLLNGNGATPDGNIPFLDLLDIETGDKERIWQSDKERYYESVVALMSDNEETLHLERLKILFSRESQQDPPQYYMKTWANTEIVQMTDFPHPYPELKDLSKEIIRYQRSDGVQLTATLYVPPGYDPKVEGPLPMLMWAYPREFKSKDAAGQVRGSPNQFSGIGGTSPLLWLSRRYAILDGPTMPIVAEGEEEPNDRFVEQLVASAQAAVDEVVRRGVAHPKKIAIGGHSYGAFMAANLLARAPDLFCCGIARSGAYNRTLTPFGFQSEERTLWEAPNTYTEMSPFMLANKIHKPLLLIHGEDDNNTGTFPMQSERFYNALKGHGAVTRLVLLPHESHGYRARESTMHTLWEMDRWMEKYTNVGDESGGQKQKEEEEKAPTGESSQAHRDAVVVVAGGGNVVKEEEEETTEKKEKTEKEKVETAAEDDSHYEEGERRRGGCVLNEARSSRKPWSCL